MSDMERAIEHWRRKLERRSGLTVREVDELEDHLRARLEVELELNGGVEPAGTLRDVLDEIGEASALSREFAKAGWIRWRQLVAAGWALFGVSLFLPVFAEFSIRYGYDVFWERWPICLPLLLTLWEAGRYDPSRSRALTWVNAAAAFYLVVVGIDQLVRGNSAIIVGDTIRSGSFLVGFWTWTAAQLLVATGCWLRTGRWRSAGALRAPG
ncbi:MAG: hypothetical protein F4106_00010 [Gemmatimonadetes bacterium]|nr:hypothetical protein [Gemmatimonadota bacterium]MXX70840.1 hypothetical protein [Gemmatimonadota bacterium]MYC93208.1 hypothetical protein [Gemmatimonadota bacterium]MYG34613.1 hypothetical protein [Gemmatimonadota bacterium]MYJ16438.1 hypothetical protein [Gemmatimonadota bacterium]